MTLLACTAILPAMSTAVSAQEANRTTLAEIVVDGSGSSTGDGSKSVLAGKTKSGSKLETDVLTTPASVSIITAKEIQMRGAESIEEVLQYTPGVQTDFYGSDDRFDFLKVRGLDATAYRDGMSVGRSFGGVREDSFAFDRVEVLKGANSTAFGVSDPGGAINYITKRPRSERFGDVYVSGGSNSRKEVGVDFGDNITSDDTLSYRVTGKLRDADAEYDYSRDDEKFFLGGISWRPTDATTLTLLYDHLNKDGVPGGGGHPVGIDLPRHRFLGEPDFNYRGVNRNTVTALLEHDFGSGLQFNTSARYTKSHTDFGYAYVSKKPTAGSTVISRDFFANDSENSQFIIDSNFQYEAQFDDVLSRSMLGAELNNTRSQTTTWYGAAPSIDWVNPIYSGRPSSVPKTASTGSTYSGKAIYAQQEFTIWDRLTLTGGLRNDWLDLDQLNLISGVPSAADYSELTTRIGASYKVTEEIAPFASYATSVAAPSVGLEPERGEQIELGVKYQPQAFPALVTASIYDLTKDNITRTNPVTNAREPIGEVGARGFELEGKFEIANNWDLVAGYSYLKTKIISNGTTGNVGNQLALVPNHSASLWVNYRLEGEGARGDATFGAGARYTGSYFFDDANTIKTKSFVSFDAAVSYEIAENTKLEANLSNIFDEKHLDYGGFGADFFNPGRAINVTLRRSW